MTLGERIKYYRKSLGITQNELAELTGIHPVSIRKYETNKMKPQPAQLERIAEALDISYNTLNGVEHTGMRLETLGDFTSILMTLCNANVLQITGEREKDLALKQETLALKFNPLLEPYLEVKNNQQEHTSNISLNDISFTVKNEELRHNLVKWEQCNFIYDYSMSESQKEGTPFTPEMLDELLDLKNRVEMILQNFPSALDGSDENSDEKTN